MPTLQVSIPHIDLAMVTALVLLWTKIRSRLVMLVSNFYSSRPILWRTDTTLRLAGAIWASIMHHC